MYDFYLIFRHGISGQISIWKSHCLRLCVEIILFVQVYLAHVRCEITPSTHQLCPRGGGLYVRDPNRDWCVDVRWKWTGVWVRDEAVQVWGWEMTHDSWMSMCDGWHCASKCFSEKWIWSKFWNTFSPQLYFQRLWWYCISNWFAS